MWNMRDSAVFRDLADFWQTLEIEGKSDLSLVFSTR